MPETDKARRHIYIPKDVDRMLHRLARESEATPSSIVAAAIKAYIDSEGASDLERTFAFRLDRISNQLGRIERDQQVLLESLALFIRYMLTVNAPIPEEDEVARAIGRDRFLAFIARVGQQIARGKRTFDAESGQ